MVPDWWMDVVASYKAPWQVMTAGYLGTLRAKVPRYSPRCSSRCSSRCLPNTGSRHCSVHWDPLAQLIQWWGSKLSRPYEFIPIDFLLSAIPASVGGSCILFRVNINIVPSDNPNAGHTSQ